MTELEKMSTEALQAELNRRRDEAERLERERQAIREATVMAHIDALIAVTPHGRTSCSDENVFNGIGSASYGARCNRCLLLDAKEQGYWPEGYTIQITIP